MSAKNNNNSIGIAVIGAGRIGRMHADIFGRTPGAHLCGVVDRKQNEPQWLAQLGYRRARLYADAAAALDDDAVTAVVIASSSDSHIALIEQAAAAGKKIFCEKPVAFTATDIRALQKRLPAKVWVQVGFNRRFDPTFCALQKALAAKQIGRVYSYHIVNRDPCRPPAAFVGKSGGMLLDFNVHDFDMLAFLSGSRVRDVFARGANLLRDPAMLAAGDIDTVMINAVLADETLANVDCTRESNFGYDQRIEVMGEGGGLRADNVHKIAATQLREDGFVRAPIRTDFTERFYESYLAQAQAFIRTCRGETPNPVGLTAAAEAVAAATAATRSLKTKTTEPVPPT